MCKRIIAYDKNHKLVGSVEFVSYEGRVTQEWCITPTRIRASVNVYSYKIFYPEYMTHDFTVQYIYRADNPTYKKMYSYLKHFIPRNKIHHVIIE